MKITKIAKGAVKAVAPLGDVPAWVGWSQLKDSFRSLMSTGRDLFIPQRSTRVETFEESLVRLGIKESDLEQRCKEFRTLCAVYLLIALAMFSYVIYLIGWERSIHGAIAGFAVTLLVLTQAFRCHFWLFQIRERKLGCTLREWFNSGFAGKST